MPNVSADRRLGRLLALVPWVAARDGPPVTEVCARFGCTEDELVADLQQLFLCGLHPYTPDMLIDVDFADGRVWIRFAEYFARPLRLTPAEGLVLLAAGHALLATPGADPGGPLGRGLAKLAAVLDIDVGDGFDVALGDAAGEVMAVVTEAAARSRQLEIEYFSMGRDAWGRRTVDPYAVFSTGGQWYLSGHCHQAGEERVFRMDRVRSAVQLDASFERPADGPELSAYRARPDDPRVVLELDPEAHWVIEQYPVERVEEGAGGRVRATLAVSSRAWLERLLLRLGPAARVVQGDASLAAEAARRVLARYRGPSSSLGPT